MKYVVKRELAAMNFRAMVDARSGDVAPGNLSVSKNAGGPPYRNDVCGTGLSDTGDADCYCGSGMREPCILSMQPARADADNHN